MGQTRDLDVAKHDQLRHEICAKQEIATHRGLKFECRDT